MFHDDLTPDTFHSPYKYFTNPLNSFSDMRKSYSLAVQIRYFCKIPSLLLILQSNNLYKCLNYTSIKVYSNKNGFVYILTPLIHILTPFDEFLKNR